MCFKSSSKVSKLAKSRMAAGMLFQTAGAQTAKERVWKCDEACGRCSTYDCVARAQRPRRLMVLNIASQIARYGGTDDSERDRTELEVGMLADRQPVHLPPKLSGTGTKRCLNDRTSEFCTRWRRSRLRWDVPQSTALTTEALLS